MKQRINKWVNDESGWAFLWKPLIVVPLVPLVLVGVIPWFFGVFTLSAIDFLTE